MNIAYIRVSSIGQNTDRQEDSLKFCDVFFREKLSGKDMDRAELKKMLDSIQPGDTVWVTELSRLGRSIIDLHKIADTILSKGGDLKSLKENIDLSSPVGVLTFNLLGSFAEFERAVIHERQAEGIAASKARGKKWGAEIKYHFRDNRDIQVYLMVYDGLITLRRGAKMLGLPGATFFRYYHRWEKDMLEGDTQ